MTKTKEQIITKIVRDLPNSDVLCEMNGSEWYGWFEECWNEAINYSRCSLQLLCVNSNVDGLTAGKYYKKLYQDRTHTKVLDEYGLETMYYSDRFIKPPSKQ